VKIDTFSSYYVEKHQKAHMDESFILIHMYFYSQWL